MRAEDGLVEEVLDGVGADRIGAEEHGRNGGSLNGARGIEAPYLQLVMERLWEVERARAIRRDCALATLGRLGGPRRIVADHLDRAMRALAEPDRKIAADVFGHLVTPGGTKIAHTTDDLAQYAAVPVAALLPVLTALADRRILRRDEHGRYEIFHDVLAAEVLDWRRRHETERALDRERDRCATSPTATRPRRGDRARRRRIDRRPRGLGAGGATERTGAGVGGASRREHGTEAGGTGESGPEEGAAAGNCQPRPRAPGPTVKPRRRGRPRSRPSRRPHRPTRTPRLRRRRSRTRWIRPPSRATSVTVPTSRPTIARDATARANAEATAARKASTAAAASADSAERAAITARARERLASARALLPTDPEQALQAALESLELDPGAAVEPVLREGLMRSRVTDVLPAGGGEVVAAFPDAATTASSLLRSGITAAGGDSVVTATADGVVRVFDSSTGALRALARRGSPDRDRGAHPGSRDHRARRPGRTRAAVLTRDGGARSDDRPRRSGPLRGLLERRPLSASTGTNETAKIWDAGTGVLVHRLAHPRAVRSATFSPDNRAPADPLE